MAEHSIPFASAKPLGLRQSEAARREYIVWPYRLLLPFLNAIAFYAMLKKRVYRLFAGPDAKPRINCWLGDGISPSGRAVKEGATTWRALETVYNSTQGVGNNPLQRWIDRAYMHIRSAQAPRNRLAMAMEGLRAAIEDLRNTVEPGEPVRILSLAAGSARGIIKVMAEMRRKGIVVESFLIDQDLSAIRYANKLAHEYGVEDAVQAKQGDVFFFGKLADRFKPDIIEMMGLVDYLDERQAVALFRKIRLRLRSGGYFFASNVHPNSESYFLRHIVNWEMYYRTVAQLRDLFVRANFLNPTVVSEPHGIQSFAYAKKES